jgi:hypothetical protein
MFVMIAIVFVGGTAAVGLLQGSEVETMRELEAERHRLLRLSKGVSVSKKVLNELPKSQGVLVPEPEKESGAAAVQKYKPIWNKETKDVVLLLYNNLTEVENTINNYFTDEDERYSQLFEKTASRAQTDWSEVAIRVTIAVLTLFLVQIFFSVYKYNRQLSAALSGKAEALEIIGENEESRDLLRGKLVSIIDQYQPGFGPAPRTPISEAIELVEKAAGLPLKKTSTKN